MMKFEVRQTPRARSDIKEIAVWLSSRSIAGSTAWLRRWEQILKTLEQRADGFGLAPESSDSDEPIYQVLFKTRRGLPYRALFLIRGPRVLILHVRGPGQDILGPDEFGGSGFR